MLSVLFRTLLCFCPVFAQELKPPTFQPHHAPLKLDLSDIRLESVETGWYLYVRRKGGIASVLLTETTRDPEGKAANYAYRASEFNDINGNEKRLLNGTFLESEYSRYSIIDSTAETDVLFGSAYCLFIPKKLLYGYPWSRNGELTVTMGTFVNIRTFEKAYADYTGAYTDNPFMFDFYAPAEKPATDVLTGAKEPLEAQTEIRLSDTAALPVVSKTPVVLTDTYSPLAAEAFKDIASGMMIYSRGPDTIVEDVLRSFKELAKEKPADVVFAVDATGSMWDDIQKLQKELIPALSLELQNRAPVRLGLLFYRDYTDNFKYRGLPVQFNDFTHDDSVFFKKLNAMRIPKNSRIGGDTPEAVYEALYAALEFYRWSPFSQRKIILIGDAEPHPSPRGGKGISKKLVEDTAGKKGITIDCIIIPDGKAGSR